MKTVVDKIDGTEYFIDEEGKVVEYDGSMYILDEKEKTARLLYVKKIKYGLLGKKDGVLRIPDVVKYGLKSYIVVGCGSAYYTGYDSYNDFHKDSRYKGGGYTTQHSYKRDFRVTTFGRVKNEVKKLIFPDTWTEESIRINSRELPEIEAVVLPKSTIQFSCHYCDNIKSITVPENVTEIEKEAFESCKSLEQVIIPNTVKRIGDKAFVFCRSLKTITIPEGVTEIGEKAFAYCECLEQVNIPNTVKQIGDGAFYECKSLKAITIPEGVTEIGEETFYHCDSLEQVNIPNTVEHIRDMAFMFCKSIKAITIPESVIVIWNEAFKYCRSLEQIIIPSKALTDDLRRELKYHTSSQIKIIETGNTTPKSETLTKKVAPAPQIEQLPKTEPQEVKPTSKVEDDYKKSAVSGCYTIGIKKDNKVVVSKGGTPCDNTMAVLREIAASVGFTIEAKWNTQQTGSKLVDFINGK